MRVLLATQTVYKHKEWSDRIVVDAAADPKIVVLPIIDTEDEVDAEDQSEVETLRALVAQLKSQLEVYEGTSDKVVMKTISFLSNMPLDTAFNYAQSVYTQTYLEGFDDKDLATELAGALYRYFVERGRDQMRWKQFCEQYSLGAVL